MQSFAPDRKSMLEKIMEFLRIPGNKPDPGPTVYAYGVQYFDPQKQPRLVVPESNRPPTEPTPPAFQPGPERF